MKICIIGTGWYGLHIYLFIKEKYKKYDINILEKENDIFQKSSKYNQNRLHLGYHYPRSFKTRQLCLKGFKRFENYYPQVIDSIDKNIYLISKDSFIDYNTFLQIFSNSEEYNHSIIENNHFKNIDGDCILVKEKVINSNKAKKYFDERIDKKDLILNFDVKKIHFNENKIIINDIIYCDILINCSFNNIDSLNETKYLYELTISLVYKLKGNNYNFDAVTIMDGDFLSLYPRDINNKTYTLTHVKYTPLIKSTNIEDIRNYKIEQNHISYIKDLIEADTIKYIPDFKNNFEFKDYFTSYKCKLLCNNDSRECNISNQNNIISVNCGKITGIFEFQEFIENFLQNLKKE